MTNPDDMAFPEIKSRSDNPEDYNVTEISASGGLTKREYFAAKAMQGMLANGFFRVGCEKPDLRTEKMAFTAVQISDCLMTYLNKGKI